MNKKNIYTEIRGLKERRNRKKTREGDKSSRIRRIRAVVKEAPKN